MKNFRIQAALLLTAALILLTFAVTLRGAYVRAFHDIETTRWSAHLLVPEFPISSMAELPVFAKEFINLLPAFARGHLLPALLLFSGAVLLLWMAGNLILKNSGRQFSLSLLKKKENLILAAVLVIAFVAILWVQQAVLLNFPLTGDENSYLFGADVFSAGKLFAESPPHPESFFCYHIINNGKWYSKYTLGWPGTLALGKLVGAERFITPLFAVGFLYMLFLLGRKLAGSQAGFLALGCAVLSPFFIFNGASYFNHTAVGFCLLLFIYSMLRAEDEDQWRFPVLAGAALLLLTVTRHLEGAIAMAGAVAWTVWHFRRFPAKKAPVRLLTAILLFFAIGVGILMLQNFSQNGSPLVFGYEKFNPEEKVSLSNGGQTPAKAAWNLVFALMRVSFWNVPLLLIFSLFAVFKSRDRRLHLLMLLSVLLAAGYYAVNFGSGLTEFGSRYLYASYALILIPAACGTLLIRDRLAARFSLEPALYLPIFLIAACIFTIPGCYRPIVPGVAQAYRQRVNFEQLMRTSPQLQRPALIFVLKSPWSYDSARNPWQYRRQGTLVVSSFTDPENRAVMADFPDRTPYLLTTQDNGSTQIMPYSSALVNSSDGYLRASLNMFFASRQRSLDIMKEALAREPGNNDLRMAVGAFCFKERRFQEAKEILAPLGNDVPIERLLFVRARISGELGEYRPAVELLDLYLMRNPGGNYARQAREWKKVFSARAGKMLP